VTALQVAWQHWLSVGFFSVSGLGFLTQFAVWQSHVAQVASVVVVVVVVTIGWQ